MLPLLTGILGTLIGLFLGNRLALGRDKRKEFNNIAAPLFENLERQRLIAITGSFPAGANGLTKSSFINLERISGNKNSLVAAIEAYEESKKSCGGYVKGHYQFTNPEHLVSAIEALQKFVPHR